jgi:hypothetical protein
VAPADEEITITGPLALADGGVGAEPNLERPLAALGGPVLRLRWSVSRLWRKLAKRSNTGRLGGTAD